MNIQVIRAAIAAIVMASPLVAEARTVARVFWQDDETANVYYGDLKKTSAGWTIEKHLIKGFPELDPDRQSLVPMRSDEGLVIVGVRDSEDGTFGSGWIAIESGVVEESHGDHSHWRYSRSPTVSRSVVDLEQGNPAHVYKYGRSFVLANDRKNGFTITSAKRIRNAKLASQAATFHDGGNGHITLAVVPERIAYATWIAPSGNDQGRIDVIGLGSNLGKSYSIHCPTGTLHGATLNSGKAFFAPEDGICWVDVDQELDDAAESVVVNHISLGADGDDQPLRTGAFSNMDAHVVFVAGKGEHTQLCLIDAASDAPRTVSLPMDLEDGEILSTPITMKLRNGTPLAVMFAEKRVRVDVATENRRSDQETRPRSGERGHVSSDNTQNKESPSNDRMLFVNLDPNRDGNFDDAKLRKAMDIGPSRIVGHSGHHAAVMLPDQRHALISNPGDGSLCVISLDDFVIEATLRLGGTPTRLLAIGG